MDTNTPHIKQKELKDDKLIIPNIQPNALKGFKQAKWFKLTGVFITRYNYSIC